MRKLILQISILTVLFLCAISCANQNNTANIPEEKEPIVEKEDNTPKVTRKIGDYNSNILKVSGSSLLLYDNVDDNNRSTDSDNDLYNQDDNSYIDLEVDINEKAEKAILSISKKIHKKWWEDQPFVDTIYNKYISIPNLKFKVPYSTISQTNEDGIDYAYMSRKDANSIKTIEDFFNNKDITYKGYVLNTSKLLPVYKKIQEYNELTNQYSDNFNELNYDYGEKITISNLSSTDQDLYSSYKKRIDEKMRENSTYDINILDKYKDDYEVVYYDYGIYHKWVDETNNRPLFIPKNMNIQRLYKSANPYNYDKNTIYNVDSLGSNIDQSLSEVQLIFLQYLDEKNAALLEADGMIIYMKEPNLDKRLNTIEFLSYDGVYEYITQDGQRHSYPKFKEFKLPLPIQKRFDKEAEDRRIQIAEIIASINKEFESQILEKNIIIDHNNKKLEDNNNRIELKLKEISQDHKTILSEINKMIIEFNEKGSITSAEEEERIRLEDEQKRLEEEKKAQDEEARLSAESEKAFLEKEVERLKEELLNKEKQAKAKANADRLLFEAERALKEKQTQEITE